MRRTSWRVTATVAVLAMTALMWFYSAPRRGQTATVTVTADATRPLQTIQGLGVNVNSRSWDGGRLTPALDRLINEMGANAFRVVIDNADWEAVNDNSDPNSFNWAYYDSVYETPRFQDLWNVIQYLNSKNVTVSLSVMGPLAQWMGGSTLATNQESEWVEMMASMIDYGRLVRHLQFNLAEPFNEPDLNGIEGVRATPAQVVRVMHALGERLDSLGLQDVRFILPDTAGAFDTYLSGMFADPYLMGKVAAIGVHSYSGSSGNADATIKASAYPATPFWMTEFSAPCSGCDTGAPNPADWPSARTTATYLMNHLTQNAAGAEVWEGYDSYYAHHSSWSYWGLLAYDQATGTYSPRKSFYAMAQFMRFIPAGSARITASSRTDVPVVAFFDQATGRATLVGMNTSTSTQTVSGTLTGISGLSSLRYYRTNATANMEEMAPVTVSGGSFSTDVAPDTLFTLTGTARPDTTKPTVTLTSPAAGATVSGITQLRADATDDRGVARVEFSVDGALVGTVIQAPFQMTWDARSVAPGPHVISARAFDEAGNSAESSAAVTVASDTTPPSTPTGLTATATGVDQVLLGWQPSTDNVAVANYVVLRDGTPIATAATTSYTDRTVAAGRTYVYSIEATDTSGNISAPSAGVPVTVASQAPLAVDVTVTTHQTTTATTIASPTFSTTKANDLLVAFAASDGPSTASSQTFSSVTGGGLTWRMRQRVNAQAGTAEIWTAVAPSTLSNAQVTARRSNGSYLGSLTVVAFSGADTTTDGAVAGASAATGAPTVSLTTTRAGSLVWAIGDDWDRAVARTVPTGQTVVDQFLASVGDTFWIQRLDSPVAAAGTRSPSMTPLRRPIAGTWRPSRYRRRRAPLRPTQPRRQWPSQPQPTGLRCRGR